jgi:hypothetical protein
MIPGRLVDRLLAPFDAAADADRRQAVAVALAICAFFVHFALHSVWYIEDAAISFAFARHLAEGHGPVAYVGGEPVQGFSNPTWTLLLAAFHAVGGHPFVMGKLLGALFGALGLPAAWAWARSVLGPRDDLAPALPAALLALSPQYVVWAASGLENGLVNFALAAGAALALREIRAPGRLPLSALAWAVLALSRPEAPALVAFGVGVACVGVAWRHGLVVAAVYAAKVAVLVGAPFMAWHAWALWTFAWEAPMTYYAKLGADDRFAPFAWSGRGSRGWRYVREYALLYGHGALLWLYAIGQSGARGWRLAVAGALLVLLHVALVPGLGWLGALLGPSPLAGVGPGQVWPFAPDGGVLVQVRVYALLAALVGLPLLGLGRPRHAGRVLAWAVAGFALFFALYAGGDWMRGHRWMSTAAVPLAVLLVDAAVGVGDALRARVGRPWVGGVARWAPIAAVAALGLVQAANLIGSPSTTPYDVSRRVAYGFALSEALDLDRPTWMDVDMGAHVWWAGEHVELMDVVGLVDTPFGVHAWQRPFLDEYVFAERVPALAHIHGGWATRTRMKGRPGFGDYVEVPPYPSSPRRTHEGNHVRRALLYDPEPLVAADEVRFASGLALRRVGVPAPTQPPGGDLTVELSWTRRGAPDRGDGRAVVFLAGQGRVHAVGLVPGGGLLPYRAWRKDEPIRGRHALRLPVDLPPGRYDLGVVVFAADGSVSPPTARPPGTLGAEPVYARGEVRWAGRVTVVRPEEAVAIVARAAPEASAGSDCAQRERRWRAARLHLPASHPARQRAEPDVREALARCFSDRAVAGLESGSPRAEIVEAGAAALRQDPAGRVVGAQLRRVASHWFDAARGREAAGDLDEAYGLLRDGLRLDPSAAWERRRAERLRDRRLGIAAQPTWLGAWLD